MVSSPRGDLGVALRVGPAYGDPDQLDRRADPRGQVAGLLVQQPDHLAAHGAAPEQREPERGARVAHDLTFPAGVVVIFRHRLRARLGNPAPVRLLR